MLLERLQRPRTLRTRARRAMEDWGDTVRHAPRGSIAGPVLLLVLIGAFIWMYPEFKRYMTMRRM